MTQTIDAVPTETRRRRSNSQLNDMTHCGWQFRLKRVLKIKEAPSVWLPGGIAFHEATEEFDRETWQLSGDALAEIAEAVWEDKFSEIFQRELDDLRAQEPDQTKWRTAGRPTQAKPNGEDVEWWATAGREMVRKYIDWRLENSETFRIAAVNGGPGIELEIKYTFGGVPTISYIDRVMVDRSGRYFILDLKTGSRTPTSPLQLAKYSVEFEALHGVQCVYGAFFDARKGVLGDMIPLAHWNENKLGIIYDTLDRQVEQGLFLPVIDSHCKGCGHRQHCIFWGGTEPLPEGQEPPF